MKKKKTKIRKLSKRKPRRGLKKQVKNYLKRGFEKGLKRKLRQKRFEKGEKKLKFLEVDRKKFFYQRSFRSYWKRVRKEAL